MLRIIEKTKLWFSISAIVILIGIGTMATRGLDFGIDFAGGSIIQIKVPDKFTNEDRLEAEKIIKKQIPDATTNFAELKTESDKTLKTIEVKTKSKTDSVNAGKVTTAVKELQETFKDKGGKDIDVASQEETGSTMGKETRDKAVLAVIIATIAMLIYIRVRFEMKFAVAAVISLVHDVLVTLTFYAVFRMQIDSGFVAAMLTVIGYSINDTIVVFDRIRENQRYMSKASVTELANASMTQTMARSINTGLAVIITLIAVYIFVPSIRNFSAPLLIGVLTGCYSSLFVATPFWVIFKEKGRKKVATAR